MIHREALCIHFSHRLYLVRYLMRCSLSWGNILFIALFRLDAKVWNIYLELKLLNIKTTHLNPLYFVGIGFIHSHRPHYNIIDYNIFFPKNILDFLFPMCRKALNYHFPLCHKLSMQIGWMWQNSEIKYLIFYMGYWCTVICSFFKNIN